MEQKDIREKVFEGYIHFNAILEIVGKPKEHVEKTLRDYINKIKEEKRYIFIKDDITEAKEVEGSMFSTFADLELMARDTESLISFCFDFMPSSVEVLEPENLKYSSSKMTDFLNDLQTRLHNLDMMVKQTRSKNQALNRNTENLLKNSIKLSIESGHDTLPKISKVLGISEANLGNIVNLLVDSGKILREGDKLKTK